MSDGRRLYGVQYDPVKDRSYPYWEEEFDYGDVTDPDSPERKTGEESRTQYDQSPTDKGAAKGRQYDVDAIRTAILAETARTKPLKVRVSSLPPTLTGITISFNKSGGDGASNHPETQMDAQVLNAGSGTLSPTATAQASASILPVVTWSMSNWQADALVNAVGYEFSLASPFTVTDILAKLNASPLSLSVTDLPVFKKKQVQLRLLGGQVSLQQSADSHSTLTFNALSSPNTESISYEYGDSYSREMGISVHVETTPECIHGTLSLTGATDTQTCTTTVVANTRAQSIGMSEEIAAITNEPAPITATASASVASDDLSATTPSSIPASGKYLVDYQVSDDEFGLLRITAIVVDFSQYA